MHKSRASSSGAPCLTFGLSSLPSSVCQKPRLDTRGMKRIQDQVEEGEGCWREWKKQDLGRQGIVRILCEKDISSVQSAI